MISEMVLRSGRELLGRWRFGLGWFGNWDHSLYSVVNVRKCVYRANYPYSVDIFILYYITWPGRALDVNGLRESALAVRTGMNSFMHFNSIRMKYNHLVSSYSLEVLL